MKFTCNREDLANAVSTVQRAISNNPTVQILNGILIETNTEGIKLTGYDLQTGIEAFVTAEIDEKGSVVVLSKFFGELVRKLPEEIVEITVDDRYSVRVICGNSNIKISGLDPEPFPKVPVIENQSNKLVLPQKSLKDMINHTNFAVSKDAARRVLTGSHLVSEGNILSVVSIDGFRMAINKLDVGEDFPAIDYIVPGKTLNEIAKILSDDENADMVIYTSDQHLLFDIGDVRIISRLIEGTFINTDTIISKNPSTVLTCDCKQLLSAADRASLIIMNSEKSQVAVQLHSKDNYNINISVATESGTMDEPVEAEIEGEMFDVDFNVKYLIDALKNITDEKIRVELNGNQGPCIIRPVEGDSYTYLLLPVRR